VRRGQGLPVLPAPLQRAVLDAGVLLYPVHDAQRDADRARLRRDVDAWRARQARYTSGGGR
jgi:hypothetical protein